MKFQIIVLLFLLSLKWASAQVKKAPLTKAEPAPSEKKVNNQYLNRITAKKSPIYPGCKETSGNNRESYKCLNRSISKDLLLNITDYKTQTAERFVLLFLITDKGMIELQKINSSCNDSSNVNCNQLKENVISAFTRLSQYIQNHPIEPALNIDDQPASMYYTIPVKFIPTQLENE